MDTSGEAVELSPGHSNVRAGMQRVGSHGLFIPRHRGQIFAQPILKQRFSGDIVAPTDMDEPNPNSSTSGLYDAKSGGSGDSCDETSLKRTDSRFNPMPRSSVSSQKGNPSTGGMGTGIGDGYDRTDALPKEMSFTWIDILAICFSICSFLFDICADMFVANFHYQNGDYWYFTLTTTFIIVPTMVMTGISLRWYVLDSREEGAPQVSWLKWCLRVLLLFLQLGPILRYFDSLIYGLKFRRSKANKLEQKKYFQYMIYEDTDATMLRLFECFMEAAPQLVLQVYILARRFPDEPVSFNFSGKLTMVKFKGQVGTFQLLSFSSHNLAPTICCGHFAYLLVLVISVLPPCPPNVAARQTQYDLAGKN